jgi:transaldolase
VKPNFHANTTALFRSMQAIAEYALHRPMIAFFARRSDTTTLVREMDATCSGECPSAKFDLAKTAVS